MNMPPEEDYLTTISMNEEEKKDSTSLDIPAGNENHDDNKSTSPASTSAGYFLRWSRVHKVVEVKKDQQSSLPGAEDKSDGRRAVISRAGSLSASFRVGKKSATGSRVILNQVSGSVAPGEMLACMGPSGSGKTSLMNVLSGRASYQEGVISINGEVLSASTMKRLMAKVAYVKQSDIFFGDLTVRDQLSYTALLRLPGHLSRKEKYAEVDRILRLLRLNKVADSTINMVSGGEKKRVNIGTELLTDPHVVLLDEPTSGLDSTSAVSLLRLLKDLAVQHSKTILTSIHQPSSAMFQSFDKLLMLSEGNVVYFGSPTDSLQYLEQQKLPCPPGYNAADHWMDLLVTDPSIEEERQSELEGEPEEEDTGVVDEDASPAGTLRRRRGEQSKKMASPRFHLQAVWDNETVAQQMDAAVPDLDDASSVHSNTLEEELGKKYPTGWWSQYTILTHRALKNTRSAIFTPLNLIKSLALGIIVGVLYFQLTYTEGAINDIRSYYFFTMTYWVFESMFEALMAFPEERHVILKERSSASYRLSAYFMAKTTSDAPVRLTLPLLYMIISYFMAGFDYRFSVFVGTVGCTLLSVLAGEALGLFIGAAIYDMQKAITTMTVFALALMLLGGFFVENMPVWIAWGKFLSPFKYAFDSSLQLVIDRPVPCDGSGALDTLCSSSTTGFASAEDVLNLYGVQGSIGFNVGLLLVICFVPRYFAYLALRFKKEGERT